MIKELEKEFDCLGENTEKYWTFAVPVEKKVTRVDKNGKEITENISYNLLITNYNLLVAQDLW